MMILPLFKNFETRILCRNGCMDICLLHVGLPLHLQLALGNESAVNINASDKQALKDSFKAVTFLFNFVFDENCYTLIFFSSFSFYYFSA